LLCSLSIVVSFPFFICYSHEVRYITLMICASLLSMWAFWKALSSRKPAWWLTYAGTLALGLFFFMTCIFKADLRNCVPGGAYGSQLPT
jgi:4-amino-4-deoxy-L-arabinose transferase-like glycosyltransferase